VENAKKVENKQMPQAKPAGQARFFLFTISHNLFIFLPQFACML
jgi:hypothetical protein